MTVSVARCTLATALVSCLLGCERGTTDLLRRVPDIGPLVTGDVARRLDGDGHFAFALDAPRPEDSEISEAQAGQLALDWASKYVHLDRQLIEDQYGGNIRFENLSACGRVLYARSPFRPLAVSVRPSVRRSTGSWWILTLCEHDTPEVWLAVSAQSGTLWNELHDGGPRQADFGSNFVWRGIPGGRVAEVLISPEEAVQRVVAVTNGVVSEIPELIAGPAGVTWSMWRVRTSQPALVRSLRTGAAVSSSEYFVGSFFDVATSRILSALPAVGVAAPDQPPAVTIHYAVPPEIGGASIPLKFATASAGPALGVPLRVMIVDRLDLRH